MHTDINFIVEDENEYQSIMQHPPINIRLCPSFICIEGRQLMLDTFVSHQSPSSPVAVWNLDGVIHSKFLTCFCIDSLLEGSPSAFFLRLLSADEGSSIGLSVFSIDQVIALWLHVVCRSLFPRLPTFPFTDGVLIGGIFILNWLGQFLAGGH